MDPLDYALFFNTGIDGTDENDLSDDDDDDDLFGDGDLGDFEELPPVDTIAALPPLTLPQAPTPPLEPQTAAEAPQLTLPQIPPPPFSGSYGSVTRASYPNPTPFPPPTSPANPARPGQYLPVANQTSPVAYDHGMPLSGQVLPGSVARPQGTQWYPAVQSWVEDKTLEFRGYIAYSEDVADVKTIYTTLNNGSGRTQVPPCTDIPQTNEEKRKLVYRLFVAIRDTDDVIDTRRAVQSRDERGKPITGQWDFEDSCSVGRVKKMSSFEIELLAWELLEAIIEAQQGYVGFSPWAKDWKYERYDTFSERFNAVLREVKISKSLLIGMCDVPWLNRIAAAPFDEVSKKVSNGISNGEKNNDLMAYRQMKNGQAPKRASRAPVSTAAMAEIERITQRKAAKRKASSSDDHQGVKKRRQ
ncbi:hypothetical protein NKR23_g6850 [Pleurostoma richardsiae]|uniref:Uncharacterized protein n=1 Tax=Pleurostoma richardsiae TaxID=41990 RepID=A0AA38VNM4_9PEZI|nr:hypothetical protein NKR23_g6850 [Pleurostoma richardsiae]